MLRLQPLRRLSIGGNHLLPREGASTSAAASRRLLEFDGDGMPPFLIIPIVISGLIFLSIMFAIACGIRRASRNRNLALQHQQVCRRAYECANQRSIE